MVKAETIRQLMEKYVEKGDLERADALYLLYYIADLEETAKTLKIRYGHSRALDQVLGDLKGLGVDGTRFSERAEDTGEYLSSIVESSFEQACVDLVVEAARRRAKDLSRTAREILYLISRMVSGNIEINRLMECHQLLFQRAISNYKFLEALDELRGCYVIQYLTPYNYIGFPPYLHRVLQALEDILPNVKVEVSWPEAQRK